MKKVLLSCVTCLLALGLVTACDNDDEVENDGGTVNPPSETTEDGTGTTTEAVTLSNYTLAFSFVDEEGEAISLGEDVDLYISSDWNNWGFEKCTLGDDGVYTLVIESIDVGSYGYKGLTSAEWVTGDTNVVIGTSGSSGNATLVVAESDGDNYTKEIVTIIDTSLVASPYDDYYSLVGDFVDADWNGWPARTSKYYLGYDPEDRSTMYWEVTVTIAETPDFGGSDPWNAGLCVAKVTYDEETTWDVWNTIVGYTELADGSTGVESWSDDSNNIKLTTWGATYNLVIDCTTEGEESILVTLVTSDEVE